jgi:hypothetical protein
MTPSRRANQQAKPIDFFDAFVSDGNAANRGAVSVEINVSPGILVRPKNAIRCVRVTDVETQEKIAPWVKLIEFAESLGHLFIAISSVRAE